MDGGWNSTEGINLNFNGTKGTSEKITVMKELM
jgi:hypothetical protein